MDSDSSLSELSSDLSSCGSLSPIPDYPSPTLTQDTENGDDSTLINKKRKSDTEEQPPAKKRKRAEPKPRKTDTLNLKADPLSLATEQKDALHKLVQVLRKRRKIVVIAGAGISVSAGIPDFRSSTGLFKTLKGEHKLKASGKQLFDASVYQTDSATSTFHDMVRQLSEQVNSAKPTAFHEMLSTLGLEGRLLRLYTQNVDGLDVGLPFLETEVPLNAKGPWPRTIQVHGGLGKMACSKCSAIFDFESKLFDGPDPPPCPKCMESDRIRTSHAGKRSHGIGRLRPRMALYNERTPDEDAIGAVMAADLRARPDALIVVGTSLKIPGVKRLVREMCGVIRDRRDGLTVWMNMDPPPLGKEFEDCWDLIVKGPCDDVASQWKDSHLKVQAGSDSEKEIPPAVKEKVTIPAESLLTPRASPPASDKETKPKLKLYLSKNKIRGAVEVEAKQPKTKAIKVKRVKKVKIPKQVKKPKAATNLASKFKVTKPGGTVAKAKGGTVKQKEYISSPLSSPQLPPIRSTPTPKTPSKSSLAKPAYFPGLLKYSPAKLGRSFVQSHEKLPDPIFPRARMNFRSSPPPHEPLSSPAKTRPALGISIPQSSRQTSKTVQNTSRRGSSSSQTGTISPSSFPRGMETLID